MDAYGQDKVFIADVKQEEGDALETREIINVRNVHKTYLLGLEGVTALRGVTFSVHEGEFIVILGTSGCGKTTLLNLLGSIDLPTKGDVTICGQKIKSSTDDKFLASLRLTHLGFVFQTFNLIQSLTAVENVELPMTLKGEHSKAVIRRRAIDLLSRVGLQERVNHFPNQLSGGEQQRVTIARALANSPKILLLDEPTGDLDTKNTDLIMKIIIDLNVKEGITIIMVTHDTVLKNFASKTVRMLDGKIAKIEPIPKAVRVSHIDALNQVVGDYGHQLVEGEENKENNVLGVRSGAVNAQNQSAHHSKTERRKPADYAALAYGVAPKASPHHENVQSAIPNAVRNKQILPPLLKQDEEKRLINPVHPNIQDMGNSMVDTNAVDAKEQVINIRGRPDSSRSESDDLI